MNEIDPSDPLISALATLAEPLRPPLPPIETIVERHERRQRRGRGRRTSTLAALAVAASVAIIVGVTAGNGSDDALAVRTTAPSTATSLPVADGAGPASDGPVVGRRMLDGEPVTVTVGVPAAQPGSGAGDPRHGPFGPFGSDRLLHRSDTCAPAGPLDVEYLVSRTYVGKNVDVYTPDLDLPAVLDISPFAAGEDGSTAMVQYPAVLVLTDGRPLTYTATFPDGSTDRITSDDAAVPLFGTPVPNPGERTLAQLPSGTTSVTATDAEGREVWTISAADPYPWLTDPACNSVDPTTIGRAASADMVEVATELILPVLRPGPVALDTLVDGASPAFVKSIDTLRATYVTDANLTATVTDVRVTDDEEVWAHIESGVPEVGGRWIQLVQTPDGWRGTRQSICVIPPGPALDGCEDVMPVFDPADPT